MAAVRLRKHVSHEWLLFVSGTVSLALGVLMATVPMAGALAIALWVGAYAFVFGRAAGCPRIQTPPLDQRAARGPERRRSRLLNLAALPGERMRKILYTMHFRGQTSPAANHSEVLRTTESAASCTMSTIVRRSGIETDLQVSEGDLAFLESELRVTGPDEFEEDGTITFGDESGHVLKFSTVGQGHITPGLEPGTIAGTANWKVLGGEGQFASACGVISSAFTISDSGERSDFHCGLIFVPE